MRWTTGSAENPAAYRQPSAGLTDKGSYCYSGELRGAAARHLHLAVVWAIGAALDETPSPGALIPGSRLPANHRASNLYISLALLRFGVAVVSCRRPVRLRHLAPGRARSTTARVRELWRRIVEQQQEGHGRFGREWLCFRWLCFRWRCFRWLCSKWLCRLGLPCRSGLLCRLRSLCPEWLDLQ